MSFPVVVPRNGTSWRNSSHTFSGDPTVENGQLGCVLCVGALVIEVLSMLSSRARAKATRVEMRVFSESCTLSDISMRDERCGMRKANALKVRTLFRTDGVHHSDEALLDEGLHPIMASSGEQGCGKHHN